MKGAKIANLRPTAEPRQNLYDPANHRNPVMLDPPWGLASLHMERPPAAPIRYFVTQLQPTGFDHWTDTAKCCEATPRRVQFHGPA